jgi:chromosome segregation ATPase
MFKILKDESANIEDLARGLVAIENHLPEIDIEYQTISDQLVDLQQDSMSGEAVTKKIKDAQIKLTDLETKKEACSRGMDQIRERIATQLPGEARARIETLDTEFQTLKNEESQLYKDFFTACAKAIACREKIMGLSYERSYQSETGVKAATPELEVRAFHHMETDDSVYFCEQTEKARKGNGDFVPVKRCLNKVIDELNALRDMVADYNPDTEVEKVLDNYR